jgi:hypothetical protein
LSDRSLAEGLSMVDFNIIIRHNKFLPYTTKSRLPKNSLLIIIYLKFKLLWKFFGKQALIIALKETK